MGLLNISALTSFLLGGNFHLIETLRAEITCENNASNLHALPHLSNKICKTDL